MFYIFFIMKLIFVLRLFFNLIFETLRRLFYISNHFSIFTFYRLFVTSPHTTEWQDPPRQIPMVD